MAIASANLFTRNIWVPFFDRNATPARETAVAKVVSLLVKAGAVAFIVVLSPQFSVNLQLLGGVWILQTFPAIVFGLYTRFFHRWALIGGWLAGMVTGTWTAYATPNLAKHQAHFGGSVYNWHLFGLHFKAYPGFIAFCINVAVVLVLTLALRVLRAPRGADTTTPEDYEEPAPPKFPAPVGAGVPGEPVAGEAGSAARPP
jgi:SSS family solute:Na+ symporter